MGAGRSHANLKQCSYDYLHNLDLPRIHTEFNNGKRRRKNYKVELCKHPNKYVLTEIPKMSTNNQCSCNTAVAESKYSLDALTVEEQLDEVERVFRERNRKKDRRNKRCAIQTAPPICCNCGCYCGGGGREPELHNIERRNGLQKVDRCDGGCQCVLCENEYIGELSEAEVIAEAIREYCCNKRERAGGRGKNVCKCCTCKQQLAAEDGKGRRQMIEEDVEDDDEDEEVEVVERKKVMKEEILIEERIESKRRGDDLTDEETIEEWATPRQRRISNESAALNPENGKRSSVDQNHAKSCKCCVCKKEATAEDSDRYSDSEDDLISLEDIELEVQTDVISMRRDEWDKTSAPQSRRPSQENTTKANKFCTCDKGTTTDFIQDAEVLMKRKHLASESSEEIKRTPTEPAKEQRRSIDEEAKAKPQRRLSEEHRSEKPTRQEQTQAKSCKCCECQRKFNENEKPMRDAETNRKPKSRQNQADPELESRRSLTRRNDEESMRRRNSIDTEQKPTVRETPPRRSVQDDSRTQQDEMAMAAARQPRRQSNKQQETPTDRRNNMRRRRTIDIEQQPTLRETPPRRSVQVDRRTQQDEMAMATAQQLKRHSNKPQETPKDRRVVESEGEDTDQQPAVESDSEAETAKQQKCCCFKRKRSQRKRGDENGCRKDCTCTRKKEQMAAPAKSRMSEKRSSSEPANRERTESQRRRRNSEQVASNNKDIECQTDCNCKKTKGVPLTKCCKCTDELVQPMARQSDNTEDMKRRKLAEVLAERLQKRTELQIALQKRLQQQMGGKQKQQRCCCAPQPFCLPCCEPTMQPETIPISCCEPPVCYCQPTPCCFETPACCYEPPPCYGQECPCCCQPMPFSYSASCSYPKPGSC